MNGILEQIGTRLARFLTRPVHTDGTGRPTPPELLLACLRPGDVLLVEGGTRLSAAISYLTQSTWTHAALFVGTHLAEAGGKPSCLFVEADPLDGVRAVGIAAFADRPTRICRPIGLTPAEVRRVTAFVIARIGDRYDLRNVVDLARYLFPTPPVPGRFRRRMLALGGGDPTRAICSTLIAQAFQSIRYPILPLVGRKDADRPGCRGCVEEVLRVRHHSLFTPRDFDVSPYFAVVKPTLEHGFDHHSLNWDDAGRWS
ncbi:MAG: lipo-like protein [Nitrospirae bacterium]|nr:lipo-like protein [Nitrospirota bacterium]